ncbi:MAG: hypothetical protein HBSAPP02_08980 [Phycisphaerae bacterium]|nr:MAG: hypothetical protein DCC66_00920 [Planctomycetota bacterium]GJQ25866.1 MAG: hypothetical protein HBSAPP02_08980 [Phycisphaerae bacterium]
MLCMAGHGSRTVHVHSVAEAYLYLQITPCGRCGRGPVRTQGELTRRGERAGAYEVIVRCEACQASDVKAFVISPPPTRESGERNIINDTSERSSAVDLLGWLTLFRSILEASEKAADKATARALAWEAAQCLDEALKFYDADNEMPPADAFFSEASRQRFREHPQHFARSKWMERRLKLPNATVRTTSAPRRKWWQFWK